MISALIAVFVIALTSFAVSFQMVPLRARVARNPLAKRSFARSTSLNSCCTDLFPTILSKEQFTSAYPDYVCDQRTQLVAPSVVGPEAIQELYVVFSQALSKLYRLCSGSRWPFLSQIVLHLVSLADMKYQPCEKMVLDKDGKEAYETHESTGEEMSSSRTVYRALTNTEQIKLVVQYRYQSLITDEAEFWEACAEGVRVCERNVLTAAKNEQNTPAESVRALPVYVALTDWVNWRFVKIENRVITVSPIITPFPVCKEGLTFNPDLATLLQYLCCAASITAQTAEDVKRLVDTENALFKEYLGKKSTDTD